MIVIGRKQVEAAYIIANLGFNPEGSHTPIYNVSKTRLLDFLENVPINEEIANGLREADPRATVVIFNRRNWNNVKFIEATGLIGINGGTRDDENQLKKEFTHTFGVVPSLIRYLYASYYIRESKPLINLTPVTLSSVILNSIILSNRFQHP
ncbi:hypothetical protein KC678_01965 [Candidatus Dojkabacteria bacterium]|uniref:Uncharacterized protein n=1 Tax=Candidatus Dojkabacteria bacterium TaxID=2099670 RepID=A0A955L1M9_9BACT|nr:hypothetical protein [Candidatus Dojkabacteria bacterium]